MKKNEAIATLIAYRIDQADKAIQDAHCLLSGNGSLQSIINRSYYAMFYATLALMLRIGKSLSELFFKPAPKMPEGCYSGDKPNPNDAIRQYIRHYTKSGDLVLDPFCGSGGTALAALMEGRKAIAIDRSPAATFITKNYCTPVDVPELQKAFEELNPTSWFFRAAGWFLWAARTSDVINSAKESVD